VSRCNCPVIIAFSHHYQHLIPISRGFSSSHSLIGTDCDSDTLEARTEGRKDGRKEGSGWPGAVAGAFLLVYSLGAFSLVPARTVPDSQETTVGSHAHRQHCVVPPNTVLFPLHGPSQESAGPSHMENSCTSHTDVVPVYQSARGWGVCMESRRLTGMHGV
jgi:hypothetical protein